MLAPLLLLAGGAFAQPVRGADAPAELSGRRRWLHVADRLTFGARPGDAEEIERRGLEAYLDEQLHPERIDDSDCDRRLAALKLKTLGMTSWELFRKYPDAQKRRLRSLLGMATPKPQEIIDQLSEAKLVRAVYGKRQLQEVMTDFWFNHFNVYAYKNQDKWLITEYERDVIRPRVFGKFRALLGAVAHSPAMLVYLDNAQSTVDARYAPLDARLEIEQMEMQMAMKPGKNKRAKLGLNENYARELLELHTLGVDGGYAQKDVTELARVLTGWSIDRPNEKNGLRDFQFAFHKRMHDPGPKTVLGRVFVGNGEREGEEALDMIARRPSTARFIARKLCRRFVADDPDPALVERVAKEFRRTDGDIGATLRFLFRDPAFYSPAAFRAKVKTPFEYVVSALRATGAELVDPLKATRQIAGMGEPLYLCEPPTGYPDDAAAWVNAGALMQRIRFALGLFSKSPNFPARANAQALLKPDEARDGPKLILAYVDAYLDGEIAQPTLDALERRLDDPEISGAVLDDKRRGYRVERLAALVIGSPDFQRR